MPLPQFYGGELSSRVAAATPRAEPLWRLVYYAVLTQGANHLTRCKTIMQTWGARVPTGHLALVRSQHLNAALLTALTALSQPTASLGVRRQTSDASNGR